MTLYKHLSVLLFLTLLFEVNKTQAQIYPEILELKQEAQWIDSTLQFWFEQVIPLIMRRETIDLWIVSAWEYNQDPIIRTMLPTTWFAARHRTILVFWDNGTEVERLAVSRYDLGYFIKKIRNPEENEDQIEWFIEFIKEKNPKKIALNTDQQKHAYVLKEGESQAPEGLKKRWKRKIAYKIFEWVILKLV